MTRKSKREVEREVEQLSGDGQTESGIIIGYEHEDGTLTDPDGDPIPEDALDRAGVVIVYDWEE